MKLGRGQNTKKISVLTYAFLRSLCAIDGWIGYLGAGRLVDSMLCTRLNSHTAISAKYGNLRRENDNGYLLLRETDREHPTDCAKYVRPPLRMQKKPINLIT